MPGFPLSRSGAGPRVITGEHTLAWADLQAEADLRIPAPGLHRLDHRLLHGADALGANLQVLTPGTIHCDDLCDPANSIHLAGTLETAQMRIASHSGTAVRIAIDHCPWIQLLICLQGSQRVTTASDVLHGRRGDILLMPPGPLQLVSCASQVLVTLSPRQIEAAALAMGGSQARPAHHWTRFAPQLIHGMQEGAMIHTLLALLDLHCTSTPSLIHTLGLDAVIHRSVALLLDPTLLQSQPTDLMRCRARAGRSDLDHLTDYIRTNLHKPLRLSELEQQSHYSRRALQYAFKDRFGMSPKQWIRDQRLDAALAALEEQDHEVSIKAIALACGYSHLGLFSSDFKKRFGMTPSAARRSAQHRAS